MLTRAIRPSLLWVVFVAWCALIGFLIIRNVTADPVDTVQPVVQGRLVKVGAVDNVDGTSYLFFCEFDAEVDTEADVVARVIRQGSNARIDNGDKIEGVPLEGLEGEMRGFDRLPVHWEDDRLVSGCAPESRKVTDEPAGDAVD